MVDKMPTDTQNHWAMKRDQPTTPDDWLDEIKLAIADASGDEPVDEDLEQHTSPSLPIAKLFRKSR